MLDGVTVCLTFDFDAMSLWIAGYRTHSPNALSRGEFGRVGAERILKLLAERELPATWFIPGHTAEAFPELCRRIADAGHEIGHHGYCHENTARMELAEERGILERGIKCLEEVTGVRPRGYRAPAGSFSVNTLALLQEYGFTYDSSLLGDDYTPYYCRVGQRAEIDEPYDFGRAIDLVELPFAWNLDDYPYFEHVVSRRSGTNPGLSAPSHVFEVWSDDFDYLAKRVGQGLYTLTMHPQVIGRGHRMLLLERLLEHISDTRSVRFARMGEYADAWRQAHPFENYRTTSTAP